MNYLHLIVATILCGSSALYGDTLQELTDAVLKISVRGHFFLPLSIRSSLSHLIDDSSVNHRLPFLRYLYEAPAQLAYIDAGLRQLPRGAMADPFLFRTGWICACCGSCSLATRTRCASRLVDDLLAKTDGDLRHRVVTIVSWASGTMLQEYWIARLLLEFGVREIRVVCIDPLYAEAYGTGKINDAAWSVMARAGKLVEQLVSEYRTRDVSCVFLASPSEKIIVECCCKADVVAQVCFDPPNGDKKIRGEFDDIYCLLTTNFDGKVATCYASTNSDSVRWFKARQAS